LFGKYKGYYYSMQANFLAGTVATIRLVVILDVNLAALV
jgi:hypothetical protein